MSRRRSRHGRHWTVSERQLLAQRLSFGTTEEQADALLDYAEPVRPDVERIKREVRAEERAQQTLETNLSIIGREYPEIFNDPILTQVAALQLSNLRGHPAAMQMAEIDQYRHACGQVRARFSPASSAIIAAAAVEGRRIVG